MIASHRSETPLPCSSWCMMYDDSDTGLKDIFQTTWVSRHQNVSIVDFTGAKADGSGGDNCSYMTCKAGWLGFNGTFSTNRPYRAIDVQSSSQIVITSKPTPSFLQARCPSCRPTNSVGALTGKTITLHGPAHPKLSRGLPTVSLTNKGFWLLWEHGYQASRHPLMPVPHSSWCMRTHHL